MARPRKGAPAKLKSYFLTHGTPNQQSEPKGYVLEGDLRNGMVLILETFLGHARSFDKGAEQRIHEACLQVRGITVLTHPNAIECLVDEHTNTICRIVYWKAN